MTRAGFAVERYPLDARRLPVCPALGDGEWLLYVNYFGIASDDLLVEVKRRWPRVIFDNTQAFFSAPRMDADSYNVYSCRKFVGVPDGAYLVPVSYTHLDVYKRQRLRRGREEMPGFRHERPHQQAAVQGCHAAHDCAVCVNLPGTMP